MTIASPDVPDDILRKHGHTRVALLRQIYGAAFGAGVDGRKSLTEAIDLLDAPSFDALVTDYRSGWLFGPPTQRSE